MRFKKLKCTAVLLSGLGMSVVLAQESVNTTGGNLSGTSGSVSYSVGQIVYTTNTGSNGSVAGGIQQPYEISVVTGIKEVNEINLSVSVYPNPATDYLILEVTDSELSALHFHLYDISGTVLQNVKITNNETRIVMSNLEPGAYFVKVIRGKTELKTFKVIKN